MGRSEAQRTVATPQDGDPAASWARYIVADVLAGAARPDPGASNGGSAAASTPPEAAVAPSPSPYPERASGSEAAAAFPAERDDDRPSGNHRAPPRADFVLLGVDEPVVLLPGEAYRPQGQAFVPARDRLPALAAQAVASLRRSWPSPMRTLRTAAEAAPMPRVRWLLLGLLWAAAFAAAIPLLFSAVSASIDFDINLWDDPPGASIDPPPADPGSSGDVPAGSAAATGN